MARERKEYSHGLLIPFIIGYLIWQRKTEIGQYPFSGSWAGIGLSSLGLMVYFLGELGALFILVQYAFLIVLLSAVLAVVGRAIFKLIWVPLLLFFFQYRYLLLSIKDFLRNYNYGRRH